MQKSITHLSDGNESDARITIPGSFRPVVCPMPPTFGSAYGGASVCLIRLKFKNCLLWFIDPTKAELLHWSPINNIAKIDFIEIINNIWYIIVNSIHIVGFGFCGEYTKSHQPSLVCQCQRLWISWSIQKSVILLSDGNGKKCQDHNSLFLYLLNWGNIIVHVRVSMNMWS